MTTKLTVTPSLLPGRVAWSLDEPDTGVNICSGCCYRKNLDREIQVAIEGAKREERRTASKSVIYTDWDEIVQAVQLAVQVIVLAVVFVISTGYASGQVNLRECPSTRCAVVETLAEGTVIVPVIGVPTGSPTGAWTQAWTPQGQGWIYSDYIAEREGQS